MQTHTVSVKTYLVVCVLLVVLTLASVSVSFAPIAGHWHLIIGLAIALVKASLVTLFFMHVLHSPRLTVAVILVACFWLFILFGLTLTDYSSRDWVPFMPGH